MQGNQTNDTVDGGYCPVGNTAGVEWMLDHVLGFAGGFGLFSLFGLGLLTVLLTQGYPLVGVTIGCGGLVCCMFSAAGLGMTFLWRPGKSEVIAPKRSLEKDMGEERGGKPPGIRQAKDT